MISLFRGLFLFLKVDNFKYKIVKIRLIKLRKRTIIFKVRLRTLELAAKVMEKAIKKAVESAKIDDEEYLKNCL